MHKNSKFLEPLLLLIILVLGSCNKDSGVDPESGDGPRIHTMSCRPATVECAGLATVSCVASDPNDDSLSYSWTCTAGSFPDGNSGAAVSWKAPENEGNYTAGVVVSDGSNSAADWVSLYVIGDALASLGGYIKSTAVVGVYDAKIRVESFTAKASSSGYYSFNRILPTGDVSVIITADGYLTHSETINLNSGDNSKSFTIIKFPGSK